MPEDIREHIIASLRDRFPGDEQIAELTETLPPQDSKGVISRLIFFFAAYPQYDGAIFLLQEALDAQRPVHPKTPENAWEVVEGYRDLFEGTSPFVPRENEPFADAAKRLRWQLGEHLG